MKDIIAIIKDRFDQLWSQIQANGVADKIHPEEGKIRLEQTITNGRTQYVFSLKDEVNTTDGVQTVALARNDVFIPNRMFVGIALVNKTTGVERLYSYIPVCPEDAPSVHAAGFQDESLNCLYDGTLAWRVGNTVMVGGMPMERFKQIPQVQGAFVLNSSDEAVAECIQGEHNIDKMAKLLTPRYTIAGTRDHKIEINLPSYAANLEFPVTEGYEAKLVLYMDGFKVVGGSEYFDGKNIFGEAVGQW